MAHAKPSAKQRRIMRNYRGNPFYYRLNEVMKRLGLKDKDYNTFNRLYRQCHILDIKQELKD